MGAILLSAPNLFIHLTLVFQLDIQRHHCTIDIAEKDKQRLCTCIVSKKNQDLLTHVRQKFQILCKIWTLEHKTEKTGPIFMILGHVFMALLEDAPELNLK